VAQPNRKSSRSKPSIARHPLFPVIVALWCAALFGVGSLALRPTLFESLVLAGHLDRFVPAAAPPLGAKAQLALVLLFGLVGAVIGWVLAKRIAGRGARPAPQVLKVADVELDESLWPGAAEKAPAPAAQDWDAEPAFAGSEPAAPAEAADPTTPEPAAAEPAPMTAAQRIAGAPLDSLSLVELMERLAIGLHRRQQLPADAPEPTDALVRLRRLGERNSARALPVPPASRPVPEETEKALRDALATLQRMSGSG
jgi:hypothetical protein